MFAGCKNLSADIIFDGSAKTQSGKQNIFDNETFFEGYKKYTPTANLVLEYNEGPLDSILNSISLVQKYICGT